MVFPKPVTALEYTFSVSNPSSCNLKKFLKSYFLDEEKNLNNCADRVLFEQVGSVYAACQFLDFLLQAWSSTNDPDFGYSQVLYSLKMNRTNGLKPEGPPRIDYISKDENTVIVSTYPNHGVTNVFSILWKKTAWGLSTATGCCPGLFWIQKYHERSNGRV